MKFLSSSEIPLLERKGLLQLIVSLLFFCVCLFFLRTAPIGSSSEAREAHIIYSIMSTGDWLLPHRGELLPSKPPLFHWVASLLASLFHLAPVTAARLLSSASAAAVVFLSMRFFSAVFPFGMGGMLLTAVALSSNYEFLRLALDSRVDMFFTALVTAAVFLLVLPLFAVPHSARAPSRGDWIMFFSLCGAATLAKGPLGLILPILIAYPFFFCRFGLKSSLLMFAHPRLGWACFLLIVLPWNIAAAISSNGGISDKQLIFENVTRFFGGDFVNTRPPWYYIVSGLRASFPWFPLFILSLPLVFSRKPSDPTCVNSSLRALALSFVVPLIFFSLASGKRFSYLAPCLPLLSIYIAGFILYFEARVTDRARGRILAAVRQIPVIVMTLAWLVILVFAVVSLPWPFYDRLHAFASDIVREHLAAVSIVLAALSLAIVLSERLFTGRSVPSLVVSWFTFQFALCAVVFVGLSVRNSFCNFQGMAERINSIVPAGKTLRVVREMRDEYLDPVLYYVMRPARILPPDLGSLPCDKTMIGKRDVVMRLKSEPAHGKFMILRTLDVLRQIPDSLRPEEKRDVIVFRAACPVTAGFAAQQDDERTSGIPREVERYLPGSSP